MRKGGKLPCDELHLRKGQRSYSVSKTLQWHICRLSLADRQRLQQMHRDIVTVIPPDATIIGSNDKCACQVFMIPNRVLSVQGYIPGSAFLMIRPPGIQSRNCRVSS